MKRNFLALAALALVVASCGESGKEDYDIAAKKVCDCMKQKELENEAIQAMDSIGVNIDMTELDYAYCVMDLEVDPLNEQMGKSIEEKCADLKPVHDNYVKSSK